MPYLTRNDIEAISRRVMSAYRKLPVLAGAQIDMVQPELLVRDLLGLSIEYHALSRNGAVLGLTACGEVGVPVFDNPDRPEHLFLDGRTLLIDKSLIAESANKGRYHFTLVHEACHQIYKMLYPREYRNSAARRRVHYCMARTSGSDYWEEWRTNVLASALLMPADMIQHNMLAFGLGDKLRMLNKVFAPHDFGRFREMADYMGVSRKALSIRLNQLGFLEIDHLENPYVLVDIFCEEDDDV